MAESERLILAPAEVTEAHLVNTVSESGLGSGVEDEAGAGAEAGLRSNVPAERGLMLPAEIQAYSAFYIVTKH